MMRMLPSSSRACGDRPVAAFRPAVLIFLVTVFSATSVDAQSTDPDRFLRWSYQDGAALLEELPAYAPAAVFGGAALLVPMSDFDAGMLQGVQRGDRGLFREFLRATNPMGGPKAAPVAAGLFAVSLLTDDARFQDAAFTSLQSILYAGTTVYSLKYTFGRFRPETGAGVRTFDMFSGNTSFPSGHTATAFALVTPWVMYYPGPLTYGLMALPVGTAVARVAKDRHWPTDVLAGAAIGVLTARYLSKRHLDQAGSTDSRRIEMAPMVAPGAVGLNLRVNLD